MSDLLFAFGACASARRGDREERVLAAWNGGMGGLVCLSVRTGFDLLLASVAFESGDEIVASAITHPDMAHIAEAHGLRVLPVDIDSETLAPRLDALNRAVGPRTRMILVAHLFGSRVDLRPIATVARQHGAMLVEDCAQSFRGPGQRGDRLADVSLFSFGSIKTATALGGALIQVNDKTLRERMRMLNDNLPLQPRFGYAKRLARFAVLLILGRPRVYGLFAAVLAQAGRDLDSVVTGAVRGFATGELLAAIRQRSSAPLLALLERRLRRFDSGRMRRRIEFGNRAAARLPTAVGPRACDHSYWVFPIVSDDPTALALLLRGAGFDASMKTSAIDVLAAPADRPDLDPVRGRRLLESVLFLPVYPELGAKLELLIATASSRSPTAA
jgi:dTDP-4-amino-4,6-dideoxygalactose transaminase